MTPPDFDLALDTPNGTLDYYLAWDTPYDTPGMLSGLGHPS